MKIIKTEYEHYYFEEGGVIIDGVEINFFSTSATLQLLCDDTIQEIKVSCNNLGLDEPTDYIELHFDNSDTYMMFTNNYEYDYWQGEGIKQLVEKNNGKPFPFFSGFTYKREEIAELRDMMDNEYKKVLDLLLAFIFLDEKDAQTLATEVEGKDIKDIVILPYDISKKKIT